MTATMNSIQLLGNITNSPEIRFTVKGIAYSDVTVAVNRRYRRRDNDEVVEEVDFISVRLWNRSAEIVHQYLKKGDPLLVEGRLKQNRWEEDIGEAFNIDDPPYVDTVEEVLAYVLERTSQPEPPA